MKRDSESEAPKPSRPGRAGIRDSQWLARVAEPWRLRRARYLIRAGRLDQLEKEETAAAKN